MGILNIFKKKTETKEEIKREIIQTYIIEFTYRGIIEKEDLEQDVYDEEYIFGKDVYSYLDEESIAGINMSWNGSNMIDFIGNNELQNKIADMELAIKDNGICHIYVKTYEELTEEDKKCLLNYVEGQASDGWGEGDFDYIYDKITKKVYFYEDFQEDDENCITFSISFWWYDNNWYIKYINDDKV